MKTNIFFIDEHNSSKQNGIGTYRNILLELFAQISTFNMTLISLNSDYHQLTAIRRSFGTEYAFPFIANGNWRDNGSLIWPLLNLYIKDSQYNTFIFNHSPCANCISNLKSTFPLSKVVFIIHDQGWCEPLFGDSNLLAAIEHGEKTEILSNDVADFVHNYCQEERNIYNIVDSVVCLSDSTEKILHEIYQVPQNKIWKIPNGYNSRLKLKPTRKCARRRLGLRLDDKLLLFVGRPARYKGVEPLLKAVALVKKTYPAIRCALVGSTHGYMSYENLVKPIAANLIYTGQITQKELNYWYAAADVGILSSYTEQCSFAALEMMNSGVIIVSSDGNGLRDMFKNAKNAYVAHIDSIMKVDLYSKKLANSICRALSASIKESRRMIKSNRQLLDGKFSPIRMAEAYKALLTGRQC